MARTVREVTEAFELLFRSFHDRAFRKSLDFHCMGERQLLPVVRTFLLGYFGHDLNAESACTLPGCLSGRGRLDFLIGNVAVEFAVRKPTARKSSLSASVNASEAKKLMTHQGLGLLVLFDFSRTPYTRAQLDAFRNWPSLGQGNHDKSAFNLAYFHLGPDREVACHRLNIRVH